MIAKTKRLLLILSAAAFTSTTVYTQNTTFNGWLFSSHEQELSARWSLLSDIQVRSTNRLQQFATILLRPGINYKFTKQQSAAIGYVYFGNWEEESGKRVFDPEHRIWEQYNLETQAGNITITNRLRLEQRFLKNDNQTDFAQRLRYYVRMQIPFSKEHDFKKGAFCAVQDELFVNVQNKQYSNGNFFDQNRIFASIGYRFSTALDIEAGYMYRYQIDTEKIYSNILQIVFSSKL